MHIVFILECLSNDSPPFYPMFKITLFLCLNLKRLCVWDFFFSFNEAELFGYVCEYVCRNPHVLLKTK